ncbi:hypothetical protein GDO78_022795, partial [Eleutherodactylus coqui]
MVSCSTMRIAALVLHITVALVKGDEVCYGHLGCFSDDPPWSGTLQRPDPTPPWSPEKTNTRFILYTKESPYSYQTISANNLTSIKSSNFQTSRKTCFIVHGLADRAVNNWVSDMCQ